MKDNKSASILGVKMSFGYSFHFLLHKLSSSFEISFNFAAKFEKYESDNKNKQG